MSSYFVTEKQLRDFEWVAEVADDRLQNDETFAIKASVDTIREKQKL